MVLLVFLLGLSGVSCKKETPELREPALNAGKKTASPGKTDKSRSWEDLPYGPINAGIGAMLRYPRSKWRNPDYEIFCFNRYPQIFYLVSGSFEIQSRFLKRLAFFTEKPGWTGILAKDEDIEGLRDWFAHDYRARDMARFFQLAREQNFPINPSETLLQEMLLAQGIIREQGGRIIEGKGALIGLSAESQERLRVYYIHETVHGLEFTMPELEKLFGEFFRSLSTEEKDLLKTSLAYRGYNVLEDERLLASETAAYLLQQRPEETDRYFREYIIPWYKTAVKSAGGSARTEAFLKNNPGIFGRRSTELEKPFEAVTGLRAEIFFDD